MSRTRLRPTQGPLGGIILVDNMTPWVESLFLRDCRENQKAAWETAMGTCSLHATCVFVYLRVSGVAFFEGSMLHSPPALTPIL